MTTRTNDRARSAPDLNATDHGRDGASPADTAAMTEGISAITEQARQATVAGAEQVQGPLLGVVRQGQDAALGMVGLWTGMLRRPGSAGADPAAARAALIAGYDLVEQLLATQRQFVDRLIAEQRRFTDRLLSPPEDR